MKTTFVRLIDYTAIDVVQNHVYFIFQINQISLKTALNITRFDPCNIRKILKIGAHKWNIMWEILSGALKKLKDLFQALAIV